MQSDSVNTPEIGHQKFEEECFYDDFLERGF